MHNLADILNIAFTVLLYAKMSEERHDDVIKWKHFPRYWPFVRGIHRWLTSGFPSQRPVTRSFDVFFYLCLNKRLSKQWWGWWFETLSRPLWRRRNGIVKFFHILPLMCQSRIYADPYFVISMPTEPSVGILLTTELDMISSNLRCLSWLLIQLIRRRCLKTAVEIPQNIAAPQMLKLPEFHRDNLKEMTSIWPIPSATGSSSLNMFHHLARITNEVWCTDSFINCWNMYIYIYMHISFAEIHTRNVGIHFLHFTSNAKFIYTMYVFFISIIKNKDWVYGKWKCKVLNSF